MSAILSRPQCVNTNILPVKETPWWDMMVFAIISQHQNGAGCKSPSLWKPMTSLSNMINITVADGLVTQGSKASAAMVLAHISQDV